jgi:UDP-N-acetylglucosamine acyltransferase
MLKQIYKALYRTGSSFENSKKEIEELRGQVPEADADIDNMLAFLNNASRGIVR